MRKTELLAPAGNALAAMAAYDAGADAIYAGLPKFNARERGENFSPEDMAKIIEHFHRGGKKVYVTMNTIVKQSELPEVAEYLAMLDQMHPDALIVQDLGVLRLVREYFPHLDIHASTQMGFHNSAGLQMAKDLGVKRVILERQISMEELQKLSECNMELEVFAHGALCCSLSGQCLFSSWLGGASGNRGRCKQPCRRRYFSKNGNGFFFSPRDLCMIDHLKELQAAGVASLKIEGRLRQPDYVTNAVRAYRMMLDAPEDADYGKLLGKARNLLSRTCGRKWSTGFYDLNPAEPLIGHESIGAAGMRLGTVDELAPGGFAFVTGKKLHVGDRVRVQPMNGEDGVALTVTKMYVNRASAFKAKPGDRVFLCCDKAVAERGVVYRIGESFTDYTARVAALPAPRKQLDLKIQITADKLSVEVTNAPFPVWEHVWELSPAQKHPLTAETVQTAFCEADSPDFSAAPSVEIDGQYFCPAAVLKNARREFWQKVKAELPPEAVFNPAAEGLMKIHAALKAVVPFLPQADAPETVAIAPNGEMPGNRKAIRACDVFQVNKNIQEAILPEFCPEGRLNALASAIAQAYKLGIRRFRATSLYALPLLKGLQGITVTAGGALPVANSMAVLELAGFGVSKVLAHVELEKTAVTDLAKASPLPVELYRYGRPVLLITRTEIPVDGDIKDARGNRFTVRASQNDRMTRVYPKEIVSVPRMPGLLDFYDLRFANWNARESSVFNFENGLQ